MSDSAHVKRTRTDDQSTATAAGFRESQVGTVAYSRTFPTAAAAEREAAAWRSTGEWDAVVVPGRAPRRKR